MKQIGSGKRLALGVGAALAAYLALLALLALLVTRGAVGEGAADTCVWVCAFAAALVGALAARGGGRMSAALCAAAFCALVLLLGFLVNDSLAPERVGKLAAASVAGGALAALPRGGKKRKSRARRSRR